MNASDAEDHDRSSPPTIVSDPPPSEHQVEDGGVLNTTPTMLSSEDPLPPRELKVDEALEYIDRVKLQFRDQPEVYNQFLDIMKDFSSKITDTAGVIRRVTRLFREYPDLIHGFNAFLPPEHCLRPDASVEASAPAVEQGAIEAPMSENSTQETPSHLPSGEDSHTVRSQEQTLNQVDRATAVTGNPSFDHAIQYVTKIKQRFSNEPDIYKEFLAILHKCRAEHLSIREVLDQITHLFRDHPDLLREFTCFLPDTLQEQAQERLNHAAEEAETQQVDQVKIDIKHSPSLPDVPVDKPVKKSKGGWRQSLLGRNKEKKTVPDITKKLDNGEENKSIFTKIKRMSNGLWKRFKAFLGRILHVLRLPA